MWLDPNADPHISEEHGIKGRRSQSVALRIRSAVGLALLASLLGISGGLGSFVALPLKSARHLRSCRLAATGALEPDRWEDGRPKNLRMNEEDEDEEGEEMGAEADDWDDEGEDGFWSDEEVGGDGEMAFWPEEEEAEAEEHVAASPENAAIDVADPSKRTPVILPADIERQRLWDMPKDALPLMKSQRISFMNKQKKEEEMDVVVLKARNANRMIERSQKLIKQGTMGEQRLQKMQEWGREHFGKYAPTDRNKAGWRSFRYRSGMRDLREVSETESYQRRKTDIRPPDQKRTRHRQEEAKKPKKKSRAQWMGSDKRFHQNGQTYRR